MIGLDAMYIESILRMALAEDVGNGDITTLLTIPASVPKSREARGEFRVKQAGVLAGLEFLDVLFNSEILETRSTDLRTSFSPSSASDGTRVVEGQCIGIVTGQPRTILTGERVALNLVQRMSGIASLTAQYVELVAHTKAKIVDTRKTTPGLRRLEKYAVTVGGGYNHRFGLDDGILIKDNHIVAAGGITSAVTTAKQRAPHTLKIEVEVTTLDELREAIEAGANVVMLDNMSLEVIREAVTLAEGTVLLEASGGVKLSTVKDIAEAGVDLISVGALTHSAPALDISLAF